jgi:hypothetical protein
MTPTQPALFEAEPEALRAPNPESFAEGLRAFTRQERPTLVSETVADVAGRRVAVPTFTNEYWTSRQRAAHSLHEISYRACFKPQLPRFFIERLTAPGDIVYDPFMGRGTTILEAALLGRVPAGCDINPLSALLAGPRLRPPEPRAIADALAGVDWSAGGEGPADLLTFYHPATLREICGLRAHLADRCGRGEADPVNAWIRMVAINRLTGHSPGFFSVYTLPPNQAASVTAQRKINAGRNQTPPYRRVPDLILRKSRALLADCDGPVRETLAAAADGARLLVGPADATPQMTAGSVDLVVTSPPFLDVVDYAGDNWLRCWFSGIDPAAVRLTVVRRLEDWRAAMTAVFVELTRVLRRGGYVAFEVGEVRAGCVRLEEHVIPCGMTAGLEPVAVIINAQQFTKTARCWGVDNNAKGTNTNRIVVFRKPQAPPPRA